MAIYLDRETGLQSDDEQFGLECPYCDVYAHMRVESAPDAELVLRTKPKHVGVVYQCDACNAPVFLRYATKSFEDDRAELFQNFAELERPKEHFSSPHLPQRIELLFKEALSCYSHGNFNAFSSMCRRTARAAYTAMGESGKLAAFDEVMAAQRLAEIDDNQFAAVKQVLFEIGDEDELPMLARGQAGILLEVMKDLLYQSFIRRGNLTRALKVRQFYVREGSGAARAND